VLWAIGISQDYFKGVTEHNTRSPFGNGVGKQSLDESSFPGEDTLMETTFLQAYRNWLTIIDIIVTADVTVSWYEHHSHMLRDKKFNAYFNAWCDMDKQLHMQFITCPFIVDPCSTTYVQLLEWACMDSFFARKEKAQLTFELQRASCTYMPQLSHFEGGGPAPHRFMPYNKDNNKGKTADSFCENKKLILCLCCGCTGH